MTSFFRLLTCSAAGWLISVPLCAATPNFDAWTWLGHTQTLHAHFEQQVIGKRGNTITPPSKGELWIQRPGRFRWNYLTPSPQSIISDGKEITWFDVQLKQAVIKPAHGALTNALAQLLTADASSIRQHYQSSQSTTAEGIQLEVKPLAADQEGFEKIRLYWTNQAATPILTRIQIIDGLGQRTEFTLSNFESSAKHFSPDLFKFKAPEGITTAREGK